MAQSLSGQSTEQEQESRFDISYELGNAFFMGQLANDFQVDENPSETGTIGLEDSFGSGFRIGYRFTRKLGVEAALAAFPSNIVVSAPGIDGGLGQDVGFVSGNLVYEFRDVSSRQWPYLTAGGGLVFYPENGLQEDLMWNVGGGVRLDLSRRFDLRLELRDYMSIFDGFEGEVVEEGAPPEGTHFQNHVVLTTGIVFSPF
jgi:hypothetical protein